MAKYPEWFLWGLFMLGVVIVIPVAWAFAHAVLNFIVSILSHH